MIIMTAAPKASTTVSRLTVTLFSPCLNWQHVVGRLGIEPSTYGLKVQCSTWLS